jgi:hypothetical protein
LTLSSFARWKHLPLGPPPDEIVYCTLEAAKSALQNHARENGYGVSVMSSRVLPESQKLMSQNVEKIQAQG